MPDLRAQAFTVAHVTGEKRPVVFLHVAEAEVKRLRSMQREVLAEIAISGYDLHGESLANWIKNRWPDFAPLSENQDKEASMPRPIHEDICTLAEAMHLVRKAEGEIQFIMTQLEAKLGSMEGRVDDPDAHNALQQASTALPKYDTSGAQHVLAINISDLTVKEYERVQS